MRRERSKLARFGAKGETVGDNTRALENRHIIEAKKREIAAAKARVGKAKAVKEKIAQKTTRRKTKA